MQVPDPIPQNFKVKKKGVHMDITDDNRRDYHKAIISLMSMDNVSVEVFVRGEEMSKIALVQEFGNPTNRLFNTPYGKEAPIPSRPFFRQTFDKHSEKYADMGEVAMRAASSGNIQRATVKLNELGKEIQKDIRDAIANGASNFAPNSPVTMELHDKPNRPLILTGALQNAVSYRVSAPRRRSTLRARMRL